MIFFNLVVLVLFILSTGLFAQSGVDNESTPLNNQLSVSTAQDSLCDIELNDVLVLASLIDPVTITKMVANDYDFLKPIKSSLLYVGINDLYLVEEGSEKYVLRLSNFSKSITMKETEFLFELEWLNFLHDNKIPVSYPIRRLDGQLYGKINAPEGSRYATLFSYAEGSTELNEERAYILGKSLAELHRASDSFETTLDRKRLDANHLIDQSIQKIKAFLGDSWRQDLQLLDELAVKLKRTISSLGFEREVYGIIAGDNHGYNQHFTSSNHLTMFDFEFCAYGHRIYDIATFKWGRTDVELWNAFLNGYQSIRFITDAEMQALDAFVLARHI